MRRGAGRTIFGLLMLATAIAPAAHAQSRSPGDNLSRNVSYSTWSVDGATVRLRFALPAAAARDLAAHGQPPLDTPAVAKAVLAAVSVTSAGGDCEAIDQGEGAGQVYTLALTPGLDRRVVSQSFGLSLDEIAKSDNIEQWSGSAIRAAPSTTSMQAAMKNSTFFVIATE